MNAPVQGWGFNANEVDPTLSIPQMPLGKHPIVITRPEVVATQSGSGGMLRLHLSIIDGPNKGAIGAWNLNLWNESTQAVDIARRTLSAICHVTSTFQLAAQPPGSELVNKPFVVNVSAQTRGEGAEKGYTQIDGVFDMQGNAPVKGQATQQQNPPQQFAPQPQQPAQPQFQPAAQQPAFAPQQPAQPAQGAQPSWGGAQQPQQPAAAAQPAWQAQPAGGAPSWNRG